MNRRTYTALSAAILLLSASAHGQAQGRTLVAVWAHADDETPVGPVLARYAREGTQVHLIIVTDGAQGGANTTIPRGPELAKVRAEEARCSAAALGARPPILLGFPDAALGNYVADPALLFRVTQRVQEELDRLRPDAIITWGPDGATGHPDHRLVSSIVTQLVRAGAPGATERLFYASIPPDGFRLVNPARGAPPFLVPQPRLLGVRIPFTTADLDAASRSIACHKTQHPDDVVQRLSVGMRDLWKGEVSLSSLLPQTTNDLFR